MKLRIAFAALLILVPLVTFAASGAIDATNHYAWNDNGGYVNWSAAGGNVTVTDTALTGYIWSAGFGWINLAPSLSGVTNRNGTLSGFAWGANTGYINFAGVTIDSNGRFHGSTVAQSLFGTMSFDCTYCNVTTLWRNSTITPTNTNTTVSGGGGTVSGSQSYGYVNSNPSAGAAPGNTNATTPPSLTPTVPPPTTQPTSGPTNGTTPPAHITPSITFVIYTGPTAVVGNPLAVTVTFNDTKRTQNIAYAYRLYRADGSIAYSSTGTLTPTSTPSFTVSIPTTGLTVGTYKVAVSAQYGKQAIATQTLSVSLYATKADASSHVSDAAVGVSNTAPSCSWWLSCWWQALVNFFKKLF